MPLTDEQSKTIKEQLLKQIENFPDDKREFAKNYILGMNNEQLEEFLAKNNLMKQKSEEEHVSGAAEQQSSAKTSNKRTDCVYCLLASRQIESLPVYEDKNYLACFEIKPFSEGHVILVPKKHIQKAKSLPARALSIANKIGKHLAKQLKAEDFHISSSDEMKHAIINIIPVYKGEKLSFERKSADTKKLQELALKIGRFEAKKSGKKGQKEPSAEIKESEAKEALIKLPRRIP